MTRTLVFGALLSPGVALACGGEKSKPPESTASCDKAAAMATAGADPVHSARTPDLVGHNCSYTTGMMAQRVVDEGAPYSYVGRLASTDNSLESQVAAPFTFGPSDDRVHVLANEVLGLLQQHGTTQRRIHLEGRILEVDDITYFVATTYKPAAS